MRTFPVARVTSKNQLTLPKRVMDAIGNPRFFEIQPVQGALILRPSKGESTAEVARRLGLTDDVLREARRLIAERQAAAGQTPAQG